MLKQDKIFSYLTVLSSASLLWFMHHRKTKTAQRELANLKHRKPQSRLEAKMDSEVAENPEFLHKATKLFSSAAKSYRKSNATNLHSSHH